MKRLVILTEIISPYRIPVFNALARCAGIDLHVIFLSETDVTQRQWLVYKDEIQFSYQVLPSWRRRLGKYHFLFNWGLEAALRQARPQMILCGGYNHLAPWRTLWWAHRQHVPFAVWVESTTRDLRGNHILVESLKARFMRQCDAFVVAGKSSAEYVKTFGIAGNRIYVAPDAVDTEFFSREAEAARADAPARRKALGLPARYFLFVGRFLLEKGVFDLLEAYRSLSPEIRSSIGLVFVGDGVAREELQRRAADISPGSIHFPGFAQREELPSYYALAEAFVFPTHSDPWGLVVNEAMACSLPVICSSAAGCAEDLVADQGNGRIVPPRDVTHLAAAMEELAGHPELRLRMGQNSRQRIEQFSPELCAAGIAEATLGPWSAQHD